MKKLLYLILTACIFFAACDFEISNNGDLDGYWQFTQVDTLATGGSADMRSSILFWSVQVNLLEIRNNTSQDSSVLFRFDKSGDILRIWNPVANIRAISDSLVTDSNMLSRYYINCHKNKDNTLETILHIKELNDEQMVLTNEAYQLHFRKY